jgi:cell division protein FtsQ
MKQQHMQLGMLTLAVFTLLGLALGILCSPALRVERVVVDAPTPGLAEEVRRQLHLPAEASMLLLPLHVVSSQAEACYRVETVQVERVFPHGLLVTVTARAPFAALQDKEGYTLVSREGICLYRQDRRPKLPVIAGLTEPRPVLGSRVAEDHWRWALDLLLGATKVGLREGMVADFGQPHRVTLRTPNGLQANLGNVNSLTRKVIILGRVVEELARAGRRVAVIDVSTPEAPVWTVASPAAKS